MLIISQSHFTKNEKKTADEKKKRKKIKEKQKRWEI